MARGGIVSRVGRVLWGGSVVGRGEVGRVHYQQGLSVVRWIIIVRVMTIIIITVVTILNIRKCTVLINKGEVVQVVDVGSD